MRDDNCMGLNTVTNLYILIYIYIYLYINMTSSTAQGGGESFRLGSCESRMVERIH